MEEDAMSFLLALLLGPRIVAICLLIFTRAYNGYRLLPILGIIFMPWTTLLHGIIGTRGGYNTKFKIIALILVILIDLGLIGGSFNLLGCNCHI